MRQETLVLLISGVVLLGGAGTAVWWAYGRKRSSSADARGHTLPAFRLPSFTGPSKGTTMATKMTPDQWARHHGVDSRMLHALIKVESGPLPPVGAQGPPIRLEVHHLLRRASSEAQSSLNQHFRTTERAQPWVNQEWRPLGVGGWHRLHTGGQDQQYRALALARMVLGPDNDVPYQAISMGKAQIMGFHYDKLGYPSASAMFAAAQTEMGQEQQFLAFLAADPRLLRALQQGDLETVVRIYNGSGQVPHYLAALKRELARTSVA